MLRLSIPLILGVAFLLLFVWQKNDMFFVAANTWFAVAFLVCKVRTANCNYKSAENARHKTTAADVPKVPLVPPTT